LHSERTDYQDNAEAGFNPTNRSVSIYLTSETARFSNEGVTIMDDTRIFFSILYELIHSVQYSEGFGVGGNTSTVFEILRIKLPTKI
jgi:hypothetical protein